MRGDRAVRSEVTVRRKVVQRRHHGSGHGGLRGVVTTLRDGLQLQLHMRTPRLQRHRARVRADAVVHGVQHVFHPLDWLDRWPSEDRRTRLVFITRGISRAWVDVLLAAIECEVAEVGVRPMGLTPR